MPLVPKAIQDLKPYSPGRPMEEVRREFGLDRVFKLASNENPWGASPQALLAIRQAMGDVHRYPDMMAVALRRRLAERFRVEVGNVAVGSGSEGIMAMIMRTFLCEDDEILTAASTFIGFMVLARASGRKITLVPRRPDYSYDLEAMGNALGERTKIVYLANPDNPTGTAFSRDAFEAFMAKVPSHVLVICDEAYFEFARELESFPDSMQYRLDNVITLRTFSKAYGLAGVRIGYGFAHEELVTNLMKVKLPFEPNVLGQVAGLAAIDDEAFLEKTLSTNAAGLELLRAGIEETGLAYLDSYTNFLTVKTAGAEACAALVEDLLRRGVIVRPLAAFGYPELLRVTVGTPEENEFFLAALREAVPAVAGFHQGQGGRP